MVNKKARHVPDLRVESGRLTVRVADRGQGFLVAESVGAGQGLANMRSRLEKIRGDADGGRPPALEQAWE
ncbi:MAG TPA: hypothetical protein PK640_09885 [Verrucomicrobiota bacterium]|nr:hypothetical protein [Verrucomicrobiota bacterium]